MRPFYYLLSLAILHLISAFSIIHANEYPKPVVRDSIAIPVEIFSGEYIAESASFTVPFSRAGNLMLIKARADSIEGNFILDTGCPGLVLNLTYFRHYTNSNDQELERTSMTGNIQAVNQATILNFVLGPVRYFRLEADLVNLGHIENTKGAKILGLLGMSLLRNFEMIIDHEKSLIHFHRIGRKEANTWQHEMLSDTAAYYTVPFEMIDQRIIIRTEMGGKKIRLIIDTGAETNILDSRLPDKVFENVTITGRIMITGAGNNRVEALQGDLSGIRIGGQHIASLPIIVTNLEKTCFSYSGCVDGILGFDFLSLQKFGFNFVTRKMYIWK
jgi:predicted aspartyl protease